MSIKHIENLSLNPFFCSHILQHFLSGNKTNLVDISQIYLVLPFIYYKDTRNLLISANKKSDIYTLFKDKKENRKSLIGLQERIEFFKDLTNQALVVGHNEKKFNVEKQINLLETVDYKRIKNVQLREYFRAAHYLGVVLSKYEFKDVYMKLGVITV